MTILNFPTAAVDFGLEASEAVFPVTTRDLQIVGKLPGCTLPVASHKAVIRTDKDGSNPRGIGVVGKDFKVLKNKDYFGAVEKSLMSTMDRTLMRDMQVNTETSYDGAWCQREYIFPEYAAELTTSSNFKTNIGFRIIAWNAYDGSSSAGCVSGLVDFFCTNGIVMGSLVDISKRRHTSGLMADHFDHQIKFGVERVQEEITMLRKLATTELDWAAVDTLLKKSFSETRAEKLLERTKVEARARGNNVFALHSALTYYSSHDSEEFGVRNTGADNVGKTLHNRQAEIAKLMPAVHRLAA